MNEYYTTDRILSKPAEYYISIGNRCNGKTTGWCIHLIDEYFENGGQFGKIERTGFIGNDSIYLSWFTDYAQKYLKEKYNHYIEVIGHNYYLVDYDDEYLPLERNQKRARKNYKPFGRTFSLGLEVKYKSTEYPAITTLIFEEFTLINQWGYLDHEVDHFLSLLSTVNRNRTNLKVVLIGNTISKYNPYFELLGIKINKLNLKQGDIADLQDKTYKNGARIRIEFAESIYSKDEEAPRILQVGGNEIAVTGDFARTQYIVDEEYDNFIFNECKPVCKLAIKHESKMYYLLQCYYKETDFYFITNRGRQYKSSGLIYAIDLEVIECIKQGVKTRFDLYKQLQELQINNILYSDEDIEYKVNELLTKCK